MHLSRSTAVFAVRLLLSVAVVYRFSHAENKSIFAQRYGPCTPPDGTKHTNVRRAGTKYKTFVKDMHYALISCGFSALAPLAEMRYTGNTKTNVKEKRDPFRLAASRQATFPKGTALAVAGTFLLYLNFNGGANGVRPLRHGLRRATLPLLSLRDIFPRSGGSLSSKGEARALPETFALHLTL